MILYRPVGMKELQLIFEAEMKAFPPRLPGQPIFYPVLNFRYAEQIAKDWNTKEASYVGYVTRFEVDDAYVSQFERAVVGASWHEELWVPAEELGKFNQHIRPPIVVEAAYFGEKFEGHVPDKFGMKGRNASEQFILLAHTLDYAPMDFYLELAANKLAVFLNYAFWVAHDFSDDELGPKSKSEIMSEIKRRWSSICPNIPLPNDTPFPQNLDM